MNNTYAKEGDYIVTKAQEVFRVTQVVRDKAGVTYDVCSLHLVDHYDYDVLNQLPIEPKTWRGPEQYKALTHSDLRHLGTLVKEEDASELFKIIYGEDNFSE